MSLKENEDTQEPDENDTKINFLKDLPAAPPEPFPSAPLAPFLMLKQFQDHVKRNWDSRNKRPNPRRRQDSSNVSITQFMTQSKVGHDSGSPCFNPVKGKGVQGPFSDD